MKTISSKCLAVYRNPTSRELAFECEMTHLINPLDKHFLVKYNMGYTFPNKVVLKPGISEPGLFYKIYLERGKLLQCVLLRCYPEFFEQSQCEEMLARCQLSSVTLFHLCPCSSNQLSCLWVSALPCALILNAKPAIPLLPIYL